MSAIAEADPREKLVFTQDWVSNHCGKWKEHLSDLIGKPKVSGLEVGVYEGRSSLWWLDNILTGEGSHLVAIEPWRDKFEPNCGVFREIFGPDRFNLYWGKGQEILMKFGPDLGPFDFAYLDGGKDADTVLQNSVLAWLTLKPGGVLIWDDYRWEWRPDVVSPKCEHPPKIGIDAFLAAHVDKYEELHRGWQVIIRKK